MHFLLLTSIIGLVMSSITSGDSPLSSHVDSPGSPAPLEDEDVIMEDDNATLPVSVSNTTERLNEMDLTSNPPPAGANPVASPSSAVPPTASSSEENVSEAPPAAKPPTLTQMLKKILLKKENAQMAYSKTLDSPDVNNSEAAQLRVTVDNLDKHVKTLSDGIKAAAAAATATAKASTAAPSSAGLKISKRDLLKFQLEDNKSKPFPHEQAYRSVDHFLSEFEKVVFSAGQDIEDA